MVCVSIGPLISRATVLGKFVSVMGALPWPLQYGWCHMVLIAGILCPAMLQAGPAGVRLSVVQTVIPAAPVLGHEQVKGNHMFVIYLGGTFVDSKYN